MVAILDFTTFPKVEFCAILVLSTWQPNKLKNTKKPLLTKMSTFMFIFTGLYKCAVQ